MTEQQERQVVTALAELLAAWWDGHDPTPSATPGGPSVDSDAGDHAAPDPSGRHEPQTVSEFTAHAA
jgi:hypothetical protein